MDKGDICVLNTPLEFYIVEIIEWVGNAWGSPHYDCDTMHGVLCISDNSLYKIGTL